MAIYVLLLYSGLSPDMDLATATIEELSLNKLNRIKKINTEAFFYCLQLEHLNKLLSVG